MRSEQDTVKPRYPNRDATEHDATERPRGKVRCHPPLLQFGVEPHQLLRKGRVCTVDFVQILPGEVASRAIHSHGSKSQESPAPEYEQLNWERSETQPDQRVAEPPAGISRHQPDTCQPDGNAGRNA